MLEKISHFVDLVLSQLLDRKISPLMHTQPARSLGDPMSISWGDRGSGR